MDNLYLFVLLSIFVVFILEMFLVFRIRWVKNQQNSNNYLQNKRTNFIQVLTATHFYQISKSFFLSIKK